MLNVSFFFLFFTVSFILLAEVPLWQWWTNKISVMKAKAGGKGRTFLTLSSLGEKKEYFKGKTFTIQIINCPSEMREYHHLYVLKYYTKFQNYFPDA